MCHFVLLFNIVLCYKEPTQPEIERQFPPDSNLLQCAKEKEKTLLPLGFPLSFPSLDPSSFASQPFFLPAATVGGRIGRGGKWTEEKAKKKEKAPKKLLHSTCSLLQGRILVQKECVSL